MADKKQSSFKKQVLSMPANFWWANGMELLERLAFFGVRAVAPLYLLKSAGENGLNLTAVEKGNIFAIWALIQCLLPMVSGGYSDRYGYKKSLYVAFTLNTLGYLGMAKSLAIGTYLSGHGFATANYWVFLATACFVATGTAIFKPPVQGTVAKTTTEETSSMGWGLFYWIVNIGGALAPMIAATLRGEVNWDRVFLFAAAVTLCNFLPAIFLFKEPAREGAAPTAQGSAKRPGAGKDAEKAEGGIGRVFLSSVTTLFKDGRLLTFLLIFSCFWLMFMQLWDLLPNFIDEWMDTSDVAPYYAWLSREWVLENGQTKAEMIININPMSIILLVIFISWLVGKINKVLAMIIGMVISLVGFMGAGLAPVGWFCCVMILVFSVGEMTCSPTFQAYVGLIAPKDKKALYMGYANIPFAIGWALGNVVGGHLYDAFASKYRFARAYLVDRAGMDASVVKDVVKLPEEWVMRTMTHVLERGDGPTLGQRISEKWQEAGIASLPKPEAAEKVKQLYESLLGAPDHAGILKANRVLWDLHHPYVVWYLLGLIGLLGTIGMVVFYLATRRRAAKDQSAKDEPPEDEPGQDEPSESAA